MVPLNFTFVAIMMVETLVFKPVHDFLFLFADKVFCKLVNTKFNFKLYFLKFKACVGMGTMNSYS